MSRFKTVVLIVLLIFTVSCKKSNNIELSNVVKSVSVSSPFTIATFYNDSIVMPYPNLDLISELENISHTISFINYDGKRRLMNSNPSNKCNFGIVTECSGYRESQIQSTLLYNDKLVLIEEKFDNNTFSNYTTISMLDIDGSNHFEIDKSEMQATKNNLIALSDNTIYYSLTNNVLIEYDYNENNKKIITNDNDHIRDVSTIFFENDQLFIHARRYEENGELINYPILAYKNNEFTVVASNVEGYVTHVNESFFIVDPSVSSNNKDAYIVYFDGRKIKYSENFFASIGTIQYEDYFIINHIEEKDGQLLTIIKLYNIENDNLIQVDELISDEMYYINAISNNIIALTYAEQISKEMPSYGIFPAYTKIEDNKLNRITKLRK